jgi:putative two-component system response regulator
MTYHPKVLVIDDDPVACEALSALLGEGGYAVRCAATAERGLELIGTGEFRVLVTDWMLPDLPGIEICKRIRGANLPSYVYIFMLSQRGRRADIVEGLSSGADDYITKPVTQGELMARLRTAERMLSLITRDVTIFALAKLAESRDPDTGAHLERVRHYSRLLAEHLHQLPEYAEEVNGEFIRMIQLTSPLHDIGKVGIPDSILLKPDRLTEEEFEVMKSHTTIGANTLEAALQAYPDALYLQMARDIALAHHERFDGDGYPLGLKENSIPLAGRIVALADTYDALTSRRIYKKAYSHSVARDIILNETAGQFDPAVVDAFISQERDICRVRQQFSDEKATFATGAGPVHSAA